MAEQFAQLAHHASGSFEQVKGWVWSRKYNGWSVIWDGGFTRGMVADSIPWYYKGKDKSLLSTGLWSLGRNNKPKVINAPADFLDKLPQGLPAHGELWFDDRLDIVKETCGTKLYHKPMWSHIQFIAFGMKPFHLWKHGGLLPAGMETCLPFGQTINRLRWDENDTFLVIKTHKIESPDDITSAKELARANKWEGLMFHNPEGFYECKRSWNNLKWKQTYETEAAVYGYEKGKTGKNIGKVGSLRCSMIWDDKVESVYGGLKHHVGKEIDFNVSGLTDEEHEWENCQKVYPIGTKIKFCYCGVSVHGVPQSPNVYREN